MRLRALALASVIAIATAAPASASTWATTVHRLIRVPVEYRQSGPGVRYPDSTDPMRYLSPAWQRIMACVRFRESRDHLVDGDWRVSSGEGWYQFTPSTWATVASSLHLPTSPNVSTGDEQSEAALWYLRRNRSLVPQWTGDLIPCHGR